MDSKAFSVTYWQWQHRYVLNAVEQFGRPDAFVTISFFEFLNGPFLLRSGYIKSGYALAWDNATTGV